jgi:hypothetical protein
MAHSVNLLFSAGRRLSLPPLVRALVGEDFKIDPVSWYCFDKRILFFVRSLFSVLIRFAVSGDDIIMIYEGILINKFIESKAQESEG